MELKKIKELKEKLQREVADAVINFEEATKGEDLSLDGLQYVVDFSFQVDGTTKIKKRVNVDISFNV